MVNRKRVIIISNPFGFGPTGGALAIMSQLVDSLDKNMQVIYGASNKCLEPLSESLRKKIKIEKIDERNPKELAVLFNKYDNPLVIICLNRVAINTAKGLGLDALFVDSLTWLWKKIPEDYLKANIYYAYNIFNAKEKLKGIKHSKLIPPALGKLPTPKKNKKDLILIHIGGFTNPLVPGFSKNYLIMLANAINMFTNVNRLTKIVIAGGSEPLRFLKSHINENKRTILSTLSRRDFLLTVNNTRHFFTTPGLNATLEAFTLKAPTSFLPPINLSQWKQLKLFFENKAASSKIEWENYCAFEWNFDLLTEKEAIPRFSELVDNVYNNNRLKSKFENDINQILLSKKGFDNSQSKFIQKVGANGAEIIAKDLQFFLENK